MLLRPHQIVVYCSDLQRSLTFYRDALGFPVKRQWPDRVELHSGMTTLVLRQAAAVNNASSQSNEPHAGTAAITLAVLDLDRFYEEKIAAGVKFTSPPAQDEAGGKRAAILDPDGLAIAVSEEKI